MTGIVLSASVRQNLLSLQSTASLLATTQNDLSTGNKVNTALDNPTSYFTAAALTGRAGDISNLLDGIGNGVQVLQAANTGITSLQSLVASAQSVANQVLQTPIGYSNKSTIQTPPIAGANVNNLLGTGSGYTDATFAGATTTASELTPYTSASETGTVALLDSASAAAVASTSLDVTAGTHLASSVLTALSGKTLDVNGKTLIFSASATSTSSSGSTTTIGLGSASSSTLGDITAFLATVGVGAASTISAGAVTLSSGVSSDVTFGTTTDDTAILGALGLQTETRTGNASGTTALATSTLLKGTATQSASVLSTQFADGNTLTVDGKTISFFDSGAGSSAGNTTGVTYVDLQTETVANLLSSIDTLSGATGSTIAGGVISLHTGTTGPLTITSNNTAALAALGLPSAGVTQAPAGSAPSLSGQVLSIAATGGGTPINITFGTGIGQVSTLNQLNSALNVNNLQATVDSTGVITVTTSNNAASATIGAISGSAAAPGSAFAGLAGGAPVGDPNAQATRAGLITQYNNILKQIDTTSQDASFNGVNLLEGDTLNLTFDETGKSTLAIQGVTFNTAGLSLAPLTAGTDFLDSNSALGILNQLSGASSTLRTEASNLGSNLSIVEIRQDFSKSLINVLQTGASQLTLADTNEEAANSQALSTRQSIAVSALALANQSQQSVLQLLR